MKLSDSFTLEEMCRTDTGLPNIPGDTEREKLLYLALFILQPVRDKWGMLNVTSGYRCPAVNNHAGGVATSQHVKGEAADFVLSGVSIDDVYRWVVKESGIRFGQCIRESKGGRDWIHISLPRFANNNQEAFVYDGSGYRPYL